MLTTTTKKHLSNHTATSCQQLTTPSILTSQQPPQY